MIIVNGWTHGGGPGPGPSLPLTNIYCYFEADNAASITQTSNLVSQWGDLSGNNRHMSVADNNQRPTWNGTDEIQFLNSATGPSFDDRLAGGITTAVNTPLYFYIVVSSDAPAAGGVPIISRNFGSVFMNYNSNGTFTCFMGNATATSTVVTANTFVCVRAVVDGNNSLIQVNNNTAGTSTTSYTSINNIGLVGSSTVNTTIKALYIYTTSVVDADIKAYISSKWGITM